jgi:MYXO-CTERM domain-containing protein
MKRLATMVLVTLLCFTNNISAAPIDRETASAVATNFMELLTSERDSSSGVAFSTQIAAGEFPAIYIFGFSGGGFVIVSGNDAVRPILGYSATASFTEEITNPALAEWLEWYALQIFWVEEMDYVNPDATAGWDRILENDEPEIPVLDSDVSALVTTTWNQNWPYNEYCPADASAPASYNSHTPTGCVATALSQVMKYWNYPATGIGSHSYIDDSYGVQSADFGATTYNWAGMPNAPSSSDPDVSTLLYHVGVAVDMDYGPTGSSANTGVGGTAALETYFKYGWGAYYTTQESHTAEAWKALLRADLDAGRPIVYRGSGDEGGHAWVCDGYRTSDDMFHFNWGWGGAYNGYFAIDNLTPGGHSFNTGPAAILNIAPSVSSAEPAIPYEESFESSYPSDWDFGGDRVSLTTSESNSGLQSVMLGTTDGVGSNIADAIFKFDVPTGADALSFRVKRKYNPGPSSYNQQYAWIRSEFGETIYETIYDGDFNDSVWQMFSVNLIPYRGQTIMFIVQQNNSSSTYKQWTYLDSVSISQSVVATPAIAPGAGSYTSSQVVTITCGTVGASIYYTTNGDDPTVSSTLYSETFTVTDSATVKARAYLDGFAASIIASTDYVIDCPTGYFGSTCAFECPGGAASPCGDHGSCDDGKAGTGLCTCSEGYSGSACATPVCSPECAHGTCTAPNTCVCDEGWDGSVCDAPICGDGILTGSEQCEKSGGVFADCCNVLSCQYKTSGISCGEAATVCSGQDTCNGSGVCQANDFGTDHTCGDAGTECVNQDYCDGSGSCSDNGFVAVDTSCGDGPSECSGQDTCNGSGTCLANDSDTSTTCGDDGTECVNQDYCDGSGSCHDNGFVAADTSCGDGPSECSGQDTCDGGGTCQPNDSDTGTTCGDAGTECVNQDYCDGSGSCSDNGFVAVDTSCGDGPSECSGQDTCDGGGTCQENHFDETTICRESAGVCDVVETCDGTGYCPGDAFKGLDVVCNAGSGDICDPDEYCTGSSADCPQDSFEQTTTVCRSGSGDVCDPDETCPGVADATCPVDVFETDDTPCAADSDGCTLDTCQSGECVAGAAPDCSGEDDQCNTGVCSSTGNDSYSCIQDATPHENTGCNADSDGCTVGDSCQSGECVAGAAPDCSGEDDQCNTGMCSSTGNDSYSCIQDATPHENASCNADSDGCTVGDSCQSGECVAGAAPDCSTESDQCNTGVCSSTGNDSYSCGKDPASHEGAQCEDGYFCSVDDACVSGVCQTGEKRPCGVVLPPDEPQCQESACNEDGGLCELVNTNEGDTCNADDNGCTISDSCQSGECVAGAAPDCTHESDECNTGECSSTGDDSYSCIKDPTPHIGENCGDTETQCSGQDTCDASGACQANDLAGDASCDDQDLCSYGDLCDGEGGCVGTAYICEPGDCELSSVCDGLGACDTVYSENGSACDENQAGLLRCYDGQCENPINGATCELPISVELDTEMDFDLTGFFDGFTAEPPCSQEALAGPDLFFMFTGDAGLYLITVTPTAQADLAIVLLDSCEPPSCLASMNASGLGETEILRSIEVMDADTPVVFSVDSLSVETAGAFTLLVERQDVTDGDLDVETDSDSDGDVVDGDIVDGDVVDGDVVDGDVVDGDVIDGDAVDGDAIIDGDMLDGDLDGQYSFPLAGEVIFTEIMADPAVLRDQDAEFIELYNTTDLWLSLGGLLLCKSSDSSCRAIPDDATIAPNDYVIFTRGGEKNGGIDADFVFIFSLENDGDKLRLLDGEPGTGTVIDDLDYTGFPVSTGISAQLDPNSYNAADNDLAENWCASFNVYETEGSNLGTPGEPNDFCFAADGDEEDGDIVDGDLIDQEQADGDTDDVIDGDLIDEDNDQMVDGDQTQIDGDLDIEVDGDTDNQGGGSGGCQSTGAGAGLLLLALGALMAIRRRNILALLC